MSTIKHNLDITRYTFDEILELFNLSYNMTLEQLKGAKKMVLMTHPDKSGLSPDYFLFYKKALDIVVSYYNNISRASTEVTADKLQYAPSELSGYDKNTKNAVINNISKMESANFNSKFNTFFDKNMVKKVNTERNNWFMNEDENPFITNETVNKSNLTTTFNKMREHTKTIVKYNGVQSLYSTPESTVSNIYEDEDETGNGDYICSDPFGKLKFDDLRKVHRDQTILSVSETDFNNMPKYKNVDEYNRGRNINDIKPMSKSEAEQLFKNKEAEKQHRAAQLQHQSFLKTMDYQKKNKDALAMFLHIENNA